MKAFRNTTEKLLSALLVLLGAMLASSVIIYFWNCFMRFALRSPMSWPEEYCVYIVVLMVFLAQCILEFRDQEICIGFLDNVADKHPAFKKVLFYFRGVVSIAIYGVLLYNGIAVANRNFFYDSITPVLHVPLGIYFTLINVGLGLAILFWVVNMLTKRFDGKEDSTVG